MLAQKCFDSDGQQRVGLQDILSDREEAFRLVLEEEGFENSESLQTFLVDSNLEKRPADFSEGYVFLLDFLYFFCFFDFPDIIVGS